MLTRLGPSVVNAGDVSSLAPFPSTLEFNPPVHGVWNIVHMGMLIPEAHQIYVCAVNCMRGVVLTAAEMGMRERFSYVVLKEEDITRGTVEQITLEGIADTLRKLPKLPPCVIVFPVCTHHFLGVSMARVYRELERQFPNVDFIRAFMDPIMRKHLSPDVRLRMAMHDPLRPCDPDERLVAVLGSDFSLDEGSDLRRVLDAGGYCLTDIQHCSTYDEYLALARASTFVAVYPNANWGAERTARRLDRRYLYLPSCFDYVEIAAQYACLAEALGLPALDIAAEIATCDKALLAAHNEVGDAPIAIDASAHPRPLGLARLLIEHGFNVTEIYLDAVSPEETTAAEWLHDNAPQVQLSSIVMPDLRVAPRTRDREVLAIGQKAAWFTGTSHFVNIVE
ncbi:MAG: hypothetical protein IJ781_11000, partial [Atopobiaceae bacterium]|nr:hypothetical protein [Atopobiaceae bacterium]